jgi:hypothetical protein
MAYLSIKKTLKGLIIISGLVTTPAVFSIYKKKGGCNVKLGVCTHVIVLRVLTNS